LLSEVWDGDLAAGYLEVTAETYSRDDGWRPVLVLGAGPDDDDPHEGALYVRDGYEQGVLSPFGGHDDLPLSGWHWGKNTLSSWEFLLPDGGQVSFGARSSGDLTGLHDTSVLTLVSDLVSCG